MIYRDKCRKGHPWLSNRKVASSGKARCLVCSKEQIKKYMKDHPEKVKRYSRKDHLKRLYGISVEQFERMFISQNKACAICKTTDFGKRSPVVDHCHSTGRVRQILCSQCNMALGMFKDNTDLLLQAVEYLIKWN